MSNVIRPDFGKTRRAEAPPDTRRAAEAICLYGEEAGYRVGLVADESEPQGPVLTVFVGALGSDEVEAVAVTPATPEGRTDADAIGLAILRTLEIVGRDAESGEPA
ncbi:hypothetical protein U8607_15330 [Methylobacterium durans]|uniref:Uncharacterized protein n=1 Tax=Methylobacterium durans TaxID=2202825 RepID=A0A2U8WGX2_9HYPH|nr:hypothetical protein [Methylobacterium durans]AWN44798.1 hypothetical protein DK389_25930 [Methylobacterium durans]MEA1833456.1 hypothetical protein [Methylobacterium durans]